VDGEPKLRKVDTPENSDAKATYEVWLDGVVLGEVTKHEKQSHDYRQTYRRSREVTRTYWLGRVRGQFARELVIERDTRSYAVYDVRANYIAEVTDSEGEN
jgi:hypothetical protein